MILRGIVPDPVARQPWGIILPLTLLVIFGASVLYSAAGGSLEPYALKHVLRYFVFLTMAMMIAQVRKQTLKQLAYPIYAVVLTLLVLVELIGGIGGGS